MLPPTSGRYAVVGDDIDMPGRTTVSEESEISVGDKHFGEEQRICSLLDTTDEELFALLATK
mgnify:CR=1 FL=1